ncbi:MAG: SIMPL domain-containing protein [Rhodospirillales bacterium]|nr:SIMPL domain-containing protein [Rhodospirillales bacterium]
MEAARAVTGVVATTGRASANRPEPGREWVASQTLTLRGADPVAVLELAGRLQQAGLAVTDMQWRLTEAPTRAAREEAARDGLRQLRARAALVADELGMQVSHFRDIYLDAAPDGPMPMMAAAMRASGPGAAPPQLAREEIIITARVTADIILTPR